MPLTHEQLSEAVDLMTQTAEGRKRLRDHLDGFENTAADLPAQQKSKQELASQAKYPWLKMPPGSPGGPPVSSDRIFGRGKANDAGKSKAAA